MDFEKAQKKHCPNTLKTSKLQRLKYTLTTGKLIIEGCENGNPGNRRLNQKVSKLQHTACNV